MLQLGAKWSASVSNGVVTSVEYTHHPEPIPLTINYVKVIYDVNVNSKQIVQQLQLLLNNVIGSY
jgi:hypothetical protein